MRCLKGSVASAAPSLPSPALAALGGEEGYCGPSPTISSTAASSFAPS